MGLNLDFDHVSSLTSDDSKVCSNNTLNTGGRQNLRDIDIPDFTLAASFIMLQSCDVVWQNCKADVPKVVVRRRQIFTLAGVARQWPGRQHLTKQSNLNQPRFNAKPQDLYRGLWRSAEAVCNGA